MFRALDIIRILSGRFNREGIKNLQETLCPPESSDDRSEKPFAISSTSINPRNEPTGTRHIDTVIVAERLKHHLLLVAHACEVERPKAHEAG
jgi:hypothetical protein